MIYLFDKKFYNRDEVEEMTEGQAELEFRTDMVGDVLMYSDLAEFATDFNNGCITKRKYLMKIFD